MSLPGDHPSLLRRLARGTCFALLALLTLWMFGAIYFDGPFRSGGNLLLGFGWLALFAAAWRWLPRTPQRLLAWAAIWLLAFLPWYRKAPSHQRDWAPEFARTPTASIQGDLIVIRNFRNFGYAPDGTPEERWETRSFHLSKLRGMDFFLNYWGSKTIGHTLFSFDFGEEGHVVCSIESRRERHERYNVLAGLYKAYELIYVVGSEADLVRLRTNVRTEEVYLYKLTIRPETARLRFLEYLDAMNRLERRPRFYNVVAANCTTSLRSQFTTQERTWFDWRILANGKLDEFLRDRGGLLVADYPFEELKRRSHINEAARQHPEPEGFSQAIRRGLPGF